MPLITRECKRCGCVQVDNLESVDSEIVTECPECQHETFAKQWVTSNFVIK
jgi:predicted nucleic acid-binding Zn ribbon protein